LTSRLRLIREKSPTGSLASLRESVLLIRTGLPPAARIRLPEPLRAHRFG
jgi:hypothetical protein